MELALQWEGPFGVASRKERATFSPPREGGVYLWTVANETDPRISYVGEASNLARRFYEHFFWLLGGAYCLYNDDHLIRGVTPTPAYEPSESSLLTKFMDEDGACRTLARRNLLSYRFWWAALEQERTIRQAVESALISAARKAGEPVQNDRLSRGEHASPRLHIDSPFPDGLVVRGSCEGIEYGSLGA